MRLKFRVAVVVATAAALLLGTSVMSAVAAQLGPQTVALEIGDAAGTGYHGAYGQGIVLQPTSLSSIELPKDVFSFEAFVTDSDGVMKWLPFTDFETIALEDTNTVQPFAFRLGMDDRVSLSDGTNAIPVYPYTIRAQYLPGGSVTTPTPSYSETETVELFKNTSTKVTFSTHGTVKRAGTAFRFHVSPNSGVGTIRVTISRPGSTTRTYSVETDETGNAASTLKLGTKNGTYKVTARFLGNQFGAASKSATKSVHANR